MSESSRSDRLALIALTVFGAVVTTVVIWDVYVRSSHRYTDYEAYRQYERNQSANEIAIGCGAKPACISEKLKARDSRNNGNDDLTAQQKMAFWTGFMGLFTALMTFITGLAVYYVRQTMILTNETLTAARKTVDVTREFGKIQSRCEISYVKQTIISKRGANALIQAINLITLHNEGLSTAKNIKADLTFHCVLENGSKINLPCECKEDFIQAKGRGGSIEFEFIIDLIPDYVQIAFKEISGKFRSGSEGRNSSLLSELTITYQDAFDDRWESHMTFKSVTVDFFSTNHGPLLLENTRMAQTNQGRGVSLIDKAP